MTEHMPVRIQMRRTKGWRKPDGVIYCGRPSKWGNPFRVGKNCVTAQRAIDLFTVKIRLPGAPLFYGLFNEHFDRIRADIEELRGHDLGCWCPLDQPCHADILLKLANKETK